MCLTSSSPGNEMTVACDYDGTLEINGQMNLSLITRLVNAQRAGDFVILWTCRDGKRLKEALQNLQKCGFCPNSVNENTPQTISRLKYNPRKVLADVYIDDKAVNIIGHI